MWFSVFLRSSKSPFNRTQRWTCCIFLTFITFVCSCMFFETGKPQPPIVTMGPIQMSANQITASIMASLIAIPPVTLVTMLFKKTRSKTQEKLKEEKYQTRREKGLRKKAPDSVKSLSEKSMHYYWTYLAYFLSIAGMLVSGFFTILYINND